MYLAIGSPPAQIVAVVLFLVAAVISGLRKEPVMTCVSLGLAALAWPW